MVYDLRGSYACVAWWWFHTLLYYSFGDFYVTDVAYDEVIVIRNKYGMFRESCGHAKINILYFVCVYYEENSHIYVVIDL